MSVRRTVATLTIGIASLGGLANPAAAQVLVSAGLLASLADHRVDVGSGVEHSTGTVAGGQAGLEWHLVRVNLSLVTGELGALGGNAVSRTMSEARLDASRPVRSWLTLHAGTVTRRYSSPIAAQRWNIVRTAVEGRFTMFDGILEAGAMGTFDPIVSVTGTRSPKLSIGGATSLAYRGKRLTVRLARTIERADFPPRDGTPRVEQLSMLTLGVGWRLR